VSPKSAIVLGAGMIGVASALHLQRRGWSVAVVDRKEPGQETSYGNTGIIQSEIVRPMPMPRDVASLLEIAAGRTNDVHYRLHWLPHHAGPLVRYWWHSAPPRHARISAAYAKLVRPAVAAHAELIAAAGAGDLVRREGYRHLHRAPAAFDRAAAEADELNREYGVAFRALAADELARAEPGLTMRAAGAIHWLEPWTCSDPGGLVAAYARLFESRGGAIQRGDAATLAETSTGWSVATSEGRIDAECVLVALGPWSPALLRPLGYRFSLVRKRGYHRHYRGNSTLRLPLVDKANGYGMAPMAQGLRITTGAEFTGPDAPPTPVQLRRAETAARELLALGEPVEADPWYGTRPCMPDMLPVVGRATRHRGLWMNFGHGHQGFTLGPITGRLVAELMSGETPGIEPHPYRPERV
jgi:D-amino-acid dehydrogenase